MTEQDLKTLSFHLVAHLSLEDEHTSTYACDSCDIGFCDHVPYRDGQPYGRAYRHYRIGSQIFRSKAKFIQALKNYNPQ